MVAWSGAFAPTRELRRYAPIAPARTLRLSRGRGLARSGRAVALARAARGLLWLVAFALRSVHLRRRRATNPLLQPRHKTRVVVDAKRRLALFGEMMIGAWIQHQFHRRVTRTHHG